MRFPLTHVPSVFISPDAMWLASAEGLMQLGECGCVTMAALMGFLLRTCRKKQANENRLKTKKIKSMKKGDRKSGKRVDF